MIERIQEKGVLKGSFSLSTEELIRGLPKIISHLQEIGVNCTEIVSSPERIEAIAPSLKDKKDMDLIIHEHSDVADITTRDHLCQGRRGGWGDNLLLPRSKQRTAQGDQRS